MSQSYSTEPTPTGLVRLHLSPSSHGSIDIALFYTTAPRACDLFIESGIKGRYESARGIVRSVKDCLIQFDGSAGTSDGSVDMVGGILSQLPSVPEVSPRLKFNHRGQVALAKTLTPTGNNDPSDSTAAGEFFITLRDTAWLDGRHVIFGSVVGGTVFNAVRLGREDLDFTEGSGRVCPDEERIGVSGFEVIEDPTKDQRFVSMTENEEERRVLLRKKFEGVGGGKGGKKRKKDRKGKRDINVLSFGGDDGEGGEGMEEDFVVTKKKAKKEKKEKNINNYSKDKYGKDGKETEESGESKASQSAPQIVIGRGSADKAAVTAAATAAATAADSPKEGKFEERMKEKVRERLKKSQMDVASKVDKDSVAGSVHTDKNKEKKKEKKKKETGAILLNEMRSKYSRGRKSQNEEDTLKKLSQFGKKGKKNLADPAAQHRFVNNEFGGGYNGEVLEVADGEMNDDDWRSTEFNCKQHLDHKSRIGHTRGGNKVDE